MYQIKKKIVDIKGKVLYIDPKNKKIIDIPFFIFCVLCKLTKRLDFTRLYHDPSLLWDLYQNCFEKVWKKKIVYENNLEKMESNFLTLAWVCIYYQSIKFLMLYKTNLKWNQIQFVKHYEQQFKDHPNYLITEKGNYLDQSKKNFSHFVKIQKSFLLLTSYHSYDFYRDFDTKHDHRYALYLFFLEKHFKEMLRVNKKNSKHILILKKIFFEEYTDQELLKDPELSFKSEKQMFNHKYLAIKKLRNFLNRGLPVIR